MNIWQIQDACSNESISGPRLNKPLQGYLELFLPSLIQAGNLESASCGDDSNLGVSKTISKPDLVFSFCKERL